MIGNNIHVAETDAMAMQAVMKPMKMMADRVRTRTVSVSPPDQTIIAAEPRVATI